MKRVEVIRLEKGQDGTFGVLRLDGRVLCVTLEPPDKGNKRDVSCIPAGEYVCRRVESPTFGTTFEVTDVPNRSHILFHQGNVVSDTHGCVLLGTRFGTLGKERGVLQSRNAFHAFLSRCGDAEGFGFVINEHCQEG
ncbi:DUF5675 family protein [Pseudodesulfovibrio sediminis]|uniref:DUF5675 domain-containing protein n=1 Tax=Pseudodesulfovibrio sediminis TaxID=2810563 RepID=A0ABN6EUG0_9BACT|nr:DUF5675 family protein [Pseudodesulfovibrio sediminis]BCS88894.1 hypothetical protein PSDVSF_21360 [Pseudodesulfovibrio sediminis]